MELIWKHPRPVVLTAIAATASIYAASVADEAISRPMVLIALYALLDRFADIRLIEDDEELPQ